MQGLLIVILIIVTIIVVCSILGLVALKTQFACPKCGTHFQVKPLKCIFAFHMYFAREVTCSNCEYRTFMKVFRRKK